VRPVPDRIGKELTGRPGGEVRFWRCANERAQAQGVAADVERLVARDGVDPKKMNLDPKLMYAVGVADVLGTGKPQVFVSSFECSGQSAAAQDTALGLTPLGSNPASKAWLYGVWADGTQHSGGAFLPNWPVAMPALSFCYDQSIDFVGESASPPVIGDFDGSGKLRIMTAGVTGPAEVIDGNGSVERTMSADCAGAACGPNQLTSWLSTAARARPSCANA